MDLEGWLPDPLFWLGTGSPRDHLGDCRPVFLFEGEDANKGENKAKDVRPNRISEALIESWTGSEPATLAVRCKVPKATVACCNKTAQRHSTSPGECNIPLQKSPALM